MTARSVWRLMGCIGCAVVLTAATVDAQDGAPSDGEWPTYGGDLGNTKYSPLDQIDGNNFEELEIAWRWQSADAFLSMTDPNGGELWTNSRFIFEQLNREDPERWRDQEPPYVDNLQATPLMVGDDSI